MTQKTAIKDEEKKGFYPIKGFPQGHYLKLSWRNVGRKPFFICLTVKWLFWSFSNVGILKDCLYSDTTLLDLKATCIQIRHYKAMDVVWYFRHILRWEKHLKLQAYSTFHIAFLHTLDCLYCQSNEKIFCPISSLP